MEFINTMDERNRFVCLRTYDTHKTHQFDSHTVSYLAARKTYQELGQTMGFDLRPLIDMDSRELYSR